MNRVGAGVWRLVAFFLVGGVGDGEGEGEGDGDGADEVARFLRL